MIEKITYKNHMNEEINFGQNGIYVNSNDLHDFAWTYNSKNNRISSFEKGIVEKTIPVVIQCDSEEEGILIKNRLFECAEKDVLAMQYGRLIIGDYYLQCYITASKKSDYLIGKNHMKTSLTVISDLPSWVKETTFTYGYGSEAEGRNLDYNNDFPYDFTSNLLGKSLNNTSFIDTNFRIIIYGACENPSVKIADHEYSVAATAESNEYITIDSINKTIILTHKDGTTENLFNKRNRESYIFEKIPVGMSLILLQGCQKADIILLEERSEPKWI